MRLGLWSFVLSLVVLAACSENFGPAPPDGGVRIGVGVESMTGPVVTRSALVLGRQGDRIWLGTDEGLFSLDPSRGVSSWRPRHAGWFNGSSQEVLGEVRQLAFSPSGELLVFVGLRGISRVLAVSDDAGVSMRTVELPRNVNAPDAIAAIDPGAAQPEGAWLVAGAPLVYLRQIGAEFWTSFELEPPAIVIDILRTGTDGSVWIGGHDGSSARVWRFEDDVVTAGPTITGDTVLDVVESGGEWVIATDAGVFDANGRIVDWPGHRVVAASVKLSGGEPVWALLAQPDGTAQRRLVSGRGVSTVETSIQVESPGDIDALIEFEGRVALVGPDASVLEFTGPASASFGLVASKMGFSAVTAWPGIEGRIAVTEFSGATTSVGVAADPAGFEILGRPPLVSTPRVLAVDPDDPGLLLLGSFGISEYSPATNIWTTRNSGLDSYDIFLGDITVTTIAGTADGRLWTGALNGDGPYRWDPGAGTAGQWMRFHEGLGEPGASTFGFGESGLPLVSQVRGFAVDSGGATWMVGFRGGVWRLDETLEPPIWRGENIGMPDLVGAAMDTCCVVGPQRQVDARSIVNTADGTLLAATGWGVFARRPSGSEWVERSLGLSNRDVRVLRVHPTRPNIVVAGSRGRTDEIDWLFLSEDSGNTWFAVDTSIVAVSCLDLVWSRPERMEVVALFEGRGAWRVELDR